MAIDIAANDNFDLEGNDGAAGDAGSWWAGGRGTVAAVGDFDTGTLTLQANVGEAGFATVGSDVTLTADGMGNFELPPCFLRLNFASGGGSEDIDVAVLPIYPQ